MQINQQEQKWLVLLYSLIELDGGGQRKAVLQHIQEQGYWYKNDANDITRTTRNEKAWRNDFSYERQHLVERGYMQRDSHGIWAITDEGRQFANLLMEQIKEISFEDMACLTIAFYTRILPVYTPQDLMADHSLVEQISHIENTPVNLVTALSNQPKPKGTPLRQEGTRNVYPRDPAVARRALAIAGHCCEIDAGHKSFLRRNSNHPYMEPHHLIPISMTDYFGVSLDREQNIFSLCSNCHNQIHYGRKEDVKQLISMLFLSREQELCAILGRRIALEEIYGIYGVL